MQYYAQHPGIAVTGIDPNGAFREYSIKNAEKNGLTAGRFTWMQARNSCSFSQPFDQPLCHHHHHYDQRGKCFLVQRA